MVLVRHDISSFSPIIARPYNLGGKQQNKHNYMQVEVRTLHCILGYSLTEKSKLATGIHT